MRASGFLSASETAAELGISLSTLYAYVSRGLLRSEASDKSKRTRRYRAEDVQRLKERQEIRRDPQSVVDTALHWGTAMLESALTLIDGGRYYYRGRDVLDLAVNGSVEQTAALLWTGEEQQADALFTPEIPALSMRAYNLMQMLGDIAPLERIQTLLPVLAVEDLAAYDLRGAQVARTGARILRYAVAIATGEGNLMARESIAAALARAWAPNQARVSSLIGAAMILCADHELNVSSFTARCVASAGSIPYAVVGAGLAALQGVKHGGATERVEALFSETGAPDAAHTAIARRIRRGENVPGFGHRLYPDGDPRGRLLLELVGAAYPQAPAVPLSMALAEAAETVLHERPNLDFGLATLSSAAGFPSGAAIALFALGRTIGWIGHAIEEYHADRLIRPRARYTGLLPTLVP